MNKIFCRWWRILIYEKNNLFILKLDCNIQSRNWSSVFLNSREVQSQVHSLHIHIHTIQKGTALSASTVFNSVLKYNLLKKITYRRIKKGNFCNNRKVGEQTQDNCKASIIRIPISHHHTFTIQNLCPSYGFHNTAQN